MDIRTLLICFFSLLSLYTVALLLVRISERNMAGIGWLAASFATSMLGAGLGAARGHIADFASIVAGNGCIMGGYLMLHRAVTDFLDLGTRHLRLGLTLLTGLLLGTTYYTYVVNDAQPRIAIVSIAYGVQASLSALLLLRAGGESGLRVAERSVGSVLATFALLNLLRAGGTLWGGAPADFMHRDRVQAAFLLGFIVTTASVGFGFLWMTSARLREALHRQATRDPLTGLLNRRGFVDAAPVLRRAAGQNGKRLLLLFADVDGLKQINDTGGHEVGDRALREAAEILGEALRAPDTLARFGGDEFCALVPVDSSGEGEAILDQIEAQARSRNALPGREYAFGISAAGILLEPGEEDALEDLLRVADFRMYATKRARQQRGCAV